MDSAVCNVCFRHCAIKEGGLGFCGARTCRDGKVICANYGRVTFLALDPIEKKPLARFYPGSLIVSVGSYGCNLRCPFCQNNEISWSDMAINTAESVLSEINAEKGFDRESSADRDDGFDRDNSADRTDGGQCGGTRNKEVLRTDFVPPEMLAATAEYYKSDGNIGVAYTYNEPLIGYEYVRDAAKLVHEKGMKNVIVTNGTASLDVLDELAPYVDAMNIDLKGFTDHYYNDILGGDRKMVMDFIEAAVKVCHVELTTLVIPGENDSEEEMAALSEWVAELEPAPEYYTNDGCGMQADTVHGCSMQADSTVQPDNKNTGEHITGADIPLHVTRFFPCFHMTDRGPTAVDTVIHLADVARQNLKYVYTGNI